MNKRTFGTTMGAVALVLATTGLGLLTITSAGASGGPHIVVTPRINLHNKEVVHLHGSGFKPGDTVFVVQCLRKASNGNGCNISTLPTPITISSTGTLPNTRFVVHTGKIGSGTCGTTKANLALCDISVGTATSTDTTSAPITFALPKKK